jgi:hypothetical protein
MDPSDLIQLLLKKNRELQKTLMKTELEIFEVKEEIHTILDFLIEIGYQKNCHLLAHNLLETQEFSFSDYV